MITFKKIDLRYNGGNVYRYILSVNNSRNPMESIRTFNEVRQWCQDTWGISYELHDAWAFDPDTVEWPLWSWANNYKDPKRIIYLKTDKEYMLAKIRWS